MPYRRSYSRSYSFCPPPPHLSNILNLYPDAEPYCAGFAPSKGRRCHMRTNARGRSLAISLLNEGTKDIQAGYIPDEDLLFDLAHATLCTRFHQNQASGLVTRWTNAIESFLCKQSPAPQRNTRTQYYLEHDDGPFGDQNFVPIEELIAECAVNYPHIDWSQELQLARPGRSPGASDVSRRTRTPEPVPVQSRTRVGSEHELHRSSSGPSSGGRQMSRSTSGVETGPEIARRPVRDRRAVHAPTSVARRSSAAISAPPSTPAPASATPSASSSRRDAQSSATSTRAAVPTQQGRATYSASAISQSSISASTRASSSTTRSGPRPADSELALAPASASPIMTSTSSSSTTSRTTTTTTVATTVMTTTTATTPRSGTNATPDANIRTTRPTRASDPHPLSSPTSTSQETPTGIERQLSATAPAPASAPASTPATPATPAPATEQRTAAVSVPQTTITARQGTPVPSPRPRRRAIEGDCSICMEPLILDREGSTSDDYTGSNEDENNNNPGLSWCKRQCGVNYHVACITRWLEASARSTCPTCRGVWRD
ncbi:hypothetical protein BDW74DRAFT_163224 [Aspergillus multicolor]|uniref:uncharacterized protein n=1 Tax=Aspergillus multicolor TaxID=41759 RepID=UPI003CCD1153